MFLKILSLYCFLFVTVETKNNQTQKLEKWGKSYDFIIVGGGTAGAVLANRLSEIKKWNILLLEAGEQPPLLSKIPSIAQSLQLSQSNWGYFSQPENNIFKGLNDNKMLWSSGKCLGGSSVINYMIYERGNPKDYDNWAKLGNEGWSFKEIFPYFLKSERSTLENISINFHNRSGLLNVAYSYTDENSVKFLNAARELGFKITDYNGQNQIGFSPLQGTIKNGQRQTITNAFIEPVLYRPNLEIVLLAEVIKIQMNSDKSKAKSVKFVKGNKTYKAFATKEIILSAGAFNSPKLLMLSGIGPAKILKKLKIRPLIADLPVGKTLKDHVTYPGLNFMINQNISQIDSIKNFIMNFTSWYINGKGMPSSLANFEAVGFLNVGDSVPSKSRPNVELLFFNSNVNSIVKSVTNIQDQVYEKLYNNTKDKIVWSIYPTLLHPKSKGRIILKSNKSSDAPLLYSKYFSDNTDIKTMIEAIKFVLNMLKTKEFSKMQVKLNSNLVPGCENKIRESDDYWECAVRTLATTSYDQFGSCKMGPLNDKEAVVDNKLKVRGIKNLRVVDASVIPATVSGRLLAATVMIAEKSADIIKENFEKDGI